jgi:hypothetical protein
MLPRPQRLRKHRGDDGAIGSHQISGSISQGKLPRRVDGGVVCDVVAVVKGVLVSRILVSIKPASCTLLTIRCAFRPFHGAVSEGVSPSAEP